MTTHIIKKVLIQISSLIELRHNLVWCFRTRVFQCFLLLTKKRTCYKFKDCWRQLWFEIQWSKSPKKAPSLPFLNSNFKTSLGIKDRKGGGCKSSFTNSRLTFNLKISASTNTIIISIPSLFFWQKASFFITFVRLYLKGTIVLVIYFSLKLIRRLNF